LLFSFNHGKTEWSSVLFANIFWNPEENLTIIEETSVCDSIQMLALKA